MSRGVRPPSLLSVRGDPILSLIDLLTAPYDGFNWLLDFVFATAYGLFARFGAPIVFVAALTESTLGLGMVFPGQQLIALGGAASAQGEGNVVAMLAFATAGTILGDVISYTAGRRFSTTLYQSRFGTTLRVAASMMEGRARWLIPFYHFYSVTRSVGPAAAGALRIPLRIWLPLDILGAAFFNTVWVLVGFAFGTVLLREDGTLKESPVVRIGLVVVAMVWFIVARQLFERRMREVREADERAAGARAESPVTE
ncbi:MAG: DedA family protein [Dehalococcoidia bacterium]